MNKYNVMFFTYSNHATQFMTVMAESKGEAKAKVRAQLNEQVYFLSVIKD